MSNQSITAEVVTVSPKMAAEWLETTKKNRPISPARVEQYARQMADGKWQMNGQPLVFNGSGVLLDGQHRCAAVRKYGKSVKMLVVGGVTSNAFLTMDTGATRKAPDLLGIEGASNRFALAAALRWLWKWERGYLYRGTVLASGNTNPVPHELLSLHKERPEVSEAVDYVNHKRKGFSAFFRGPIGFIYYLLNQIDPADARTFFDSIVVGASLENDDPRFRLRNRLLRSKQNPQYRMTARVQMALFIKAWNMWREGEACSALSFKPSVEEFPNPI